jgi:hypothetical protein
MRWTASARASPLTPTRSPACSTGPGARPAGQAACRTAQPISAAPGWRRRAARCRSIMWNTATDGRAAAMAGRAPWRCCCRARSTRSRNAGAAGRPSARRRADGGGHRLQPRLLAADLAPAGDEHGLHAVRPDAREALAGATRTPRARSVFRLRRDRAGQARRSRDLGCGTPGGARLPASASTRCMSAFSKAPHERALTPGVSRARSPSSKRSGATGRCRAARPAARRRRGGGRTWSPRRPGRCAGLRRQHRLRQTRLVRIARRGHATLQRNLIPRIAVASASRWRRDHRAADDGAQAAVARARRLGRALGGNRADRGHAGGGVTPVIPAQGSVGASGDLAPLAHMAAAMIGEGEAFFGGRAHARRRSAGARRAEPVVLGPRKGWR